MAIFTFLGTGKLKRDFVFINCDMKSTLNFTFKRRFPRKSTCSNGPPFGLLTDSADCDIYDTVFDAEFKYVFKKFLRLAVLEI